jgi:hypothetical protein
MARIRLEIDVPISEQELFDYVLEVMRRDDPEADDISAYDVVGLLYSGELEYMAGGRFEVIDDVIEDI